MENNNIRLKWLDVAKGIAILLVVFGHVEESIFKSPFLTSPIGLEIANKIVYSFHMPFLFCLSGYSFAHAYIQDKNIRMDRWKRQLRNLIVLYIVWSCIYWCFKFVFSNYVYDNVDLSDLFLIPIRAIKFHWYLYVLIVLYLLIVPINSAIERKSIFKYLFLGIGGGVE